MNPYDKDLIARFAPAYVIAGAYAVYSVFQIRKINQQRENSRIEHEARMEETEKAARERMEQHMAWRASQPNIDDIMEAARKEVGSVDDIRQKMDDPNHIWEL